MTGIHICIGVLVVAVIYVDRFLMKAIGRLTDIYASIYDTDIMVSYRKELTNGRTYIRGSFTLDDIVSHCSGLIDSCSVCVSETVHASCKYVSPYAYRIVNYSANDCQLVAEFLISILVALSGVGFVLVCLLANEIVTAASLSLGLFEILLLITCITYIVLNKFLLERAKPVTCSYKYALTRTRSNKKTLYYVFEESGRNCIATSYTYGKVLPLYGELLECSVVRKIGRRNHYKVVSMSKRRLIFKYVLGVLLVLIAASVLLILLLILLRNYIP